MTLKRIVAVTVAAVTVAALAQNPNSQEHPAVPVVTFNLLWEAATPQNYTVWVRSTGTARYVSSNPARAPENRDEDPGYSLEFTMSGPNLAKVFALTKQAGYFDGDFDYKKHALANTGRKTLSYADLSRNFETTFNWSENVAIDRLARFFSGVSSTVEHGRKLVYLHRYDKLGLEAELKGMENEAQSGYLTEIQIVAPTLESIANDSSVLNIARARARRLMELSQKELAGGK